MIRAKCVRPQYKRCLRFLAQTHEMNEIEFAMLKSAVVKSNSVKTWIIL